MKHLQQSSTGGFPEFNDRPIPHVEAELSTFDTTHSLLQIDTLLELGFSWEEAQKLLCLRDGLYDLPEMRQRLADDSRLLFARWLFEHGELHDN